MSEWIHVLNVDASYNGDQRVTGVGIVVRERIARTRRARIVEQISEGHRGVPPGCREKFAVLRALEIAIERGFTRVKIRSDYNSMRRRLREQHAGRRDSDGDDLHRRVLQLADSLPWVGFSYIGRRKNGTAHRLAREGRFKEPAGISTTR